MHFFTVGAPEMKWGWLEGMCGILVSVYVDFLREELEIGGLN